VSGASEVSMLEQALLDRAKSLAAEHLARAQSIHDKIIEDANDHLRLSEEREVLTAKAEADRTYRRRVQAGELAKQAELDRLRWQLIEQVIDEIRQGLRAFADGDQQAYQEVLLKLLVQGAQAIERDELVARFNEHDREQLRPQWESFAMHAVPGKSIALSEDACECIGGVRVSSFDGRILVDNTFEGRMERMENDIQRIITERLFASASSMGELFRV